MNCGCSKHLGCFMKEDKVETGVIAPCTGDFTVYVEYNGQMYEETHSFLIGNSIFIPNDYNEDAEICFKVQLPLVCRGDGNHFITSDDGACSFCFTSIIKGC